LVLAPPGPLGFAPPELDELPPLPEFNVGAGEHATLAYAKMLATLRALVLLILDSVAG
jgi:hypothetical protein